MLCLLGIAMLMTPLLHAAAPKKEEDAPADFSDAESEEEQKNTPKILAKETVPFGFTNFEKKKEATFSDDAPEWRTIHKGLNLEGICINQACKAYNKKVWAPQKFGTFSIEKVIWKATCPLDKCKSKIQKVETCGFFQCSYTIEGVYLTKNGKEKELEQKGCHNKQEGFDIFIGGGENSHKYLWLEIKVTPLDNKKENKETLFL